MAMRGTRESTWLVVARCLAIIRRVRQGPPTDWRGLAEAVRAEVGKDAYGDATDQALHKRVENDLARIRKHLGIEIRYSGKEKGYIFVRD
jgi:hypothetical protein